MMRAWLTQHGYVLAQALKRFASAPITSLLSIIVIGIAFSLPVGVYTLMENLKAFSGQVSGSPQLSLFLKLDASKTQVDKIKQRLEKHPQVERFQFIPKATALRQLQRNSGLDDTVVSLERNPLPDAFIVDALEASPELLEKLYFSMQQWPEIEYVQFDSDWAKRLDALLNLGQITVFILASILSLALVAVMFNTIRLQILTKRDEIEVAKLIGATDSFIRRPFLYFGALQGLAGGILAWLIIAFAIQFMNEKLAVLAQLYAMELYLQHISIEDSISLLLFSAWLGWLGARLSVASHLWQIDPK